MIKGILSNHITRERGQAGRSCVWYFLLNGMVANMYTNLLSISVIALVVGVILTLDTVVLVSGISGIMFCLSIIIESFGTTDLI
jgi:hypothetical protein